MKNASSCNARTGRPTCTFSTSSFPLCQAGKGFCTPPFRLCALRARSFGLRAARISRSRCRWRSTFCSSPRIFLPHTYWDSSSSPRNFLDASLFHISFTSIPCLSSISFRFITNTWYAAPLRKPFTSSTTCDVFIPQRQFQ